MTVDVAAGTVAVSTDVVCAWSTVGLHPIYAAGSRLRLDDAVRVDHRRHLLEDLNRFAIPQRMPDAEIPVVGRFDPDLGMSPWSAEPSAWPVTALPADEAVHAAEVQSPAAAERLDMALRPDVHDPGIELHRQDAGYPVVDADDPSVYDDLVRRAADAADRARPSS